MVRALGKICLKVTLQLGRGHTAVDLAHIVAQDVTNRLVEILFLVIPATRTHATHHDALDRTVFFKARLMHLERTARVHAIGRGAIKANVRKRLEQFLSDLRIDGPGLEHLTMAVAHDGPIGAAGVKRQARKAMLADRQRRASSRGNHMQASPGQLADGTADGPIRLMQCVQQRSV